MEGLGGPQYLDFLLRGGDEDVDRLIDGLLIGTTRDRRMLIGPRCSGTKIASNVAPSKVNN